MAINGGIEIITSSFLGVFTAQFIKFVSYYLKFEKFNFKMFTLTGGMPSSHSSFSVALTVSVGLTAGFNSVEFAIALGFAAVVMYDAAGLRRAAGKTAALLNKIVDDYYSERDSKPAKEKLMEVLGHTPFEVLIGAILGIFIAYFTHFIIFA
ncbi:MAG TPA: divergent PAP2 family protein [Candidatus Gastranaerophilales bacterium]|nr:divergent PAP2 family protein [Candidatus Gastranaerophilales bacterium]